MKNPLKLLLILSFSVGCQPQKEIIRETVIVSNRTNQMGGVDEAGGGSGVNGKPLDEFIDRQFDQKPAYRNVVRPIIERLKQGYPELAADFIHLSKRRDWYFVPGELERIPQLILGAYAKYEQYALQDTNKIWIDNKEYSQMSERSQGILLVHELTMGVRLLKYKHGQDRCIANATQFLFESDGESKYRSAFKSCTSQYPIVDGVTKDQSFRLNNEDYEVIRRIVSFLIQEEIDFEEVRHLIRNHHIRD
jgi:hypothetical protein